MTKGKYAILALLSMLFFNNLVYSKDVWAFLGLPKKMSKEELVSRVEMFDNLTKRFNEEFFDSYLKNYVKNNQNPLGVLALPKAEREALIPFLVEYKNYFQDLEKYVVTYSLNPTMKSQHMKIAVKIVFYSNAVEFLDTMISTSALVGIFDEDLSEYGIPINYFRNLISMTARQRFKSLNDWDESWIMSEEDESYTVMDYVISSKSLIRHLRKSKAGDEVYDIVEMSLSDYKFYNETFINKVRKYVSSRVGVNGTLYDIKKFVLTSLSKVHWDDPDMLKQKDFKKIDDNLQPGDIVVVGSNLILSNLIFKGENGVSHGALYIGEYDQLKTVFDNDPETHEYYQKLCAAKGLDCDSYTSYLKEVYPKIMTKYKRGEKRTPYTVIEAMAPGVIFSTTEHAFKRNRVFAFRPRLRKLDMAMAISHALSTVGRAYDYNFDSRTSDLLVCTEVIMHSYKTDVRTGQRGIDWDVGHALGVPSMRADHVISTYRMRDSQLELVLGIDTDNKYNPDLITE